MIPEESQPTSRGGGLTSPDANRAALISTGRQLISLAVPIMGSNILGLLDGSINAMWVGRFLGDTALAAASNANTLLIFLLVMAFGIWTALTVRVGYYSGINNEKDAKAVIRAACVIFTILGISVATAGEVAAGPLLRALGVQPASLLQAEQYLHLILISVPVSYLYGTIVAILQGAGDTSTTFYFSLLSVGVDAGLNPILIFGVGPLPRMGIRGAALATVLAQATGLAGLVIFLLRRTHLLCLSKHRFVMQRAEWRMAGELLRRGGPIGMEFLGQSLLAILIISLVNRFGPDVTAAFGAVSQLWNWVMVPSMAFSLASTSMAANSLGRGNWRRVRIVTQLGISFSLVSASALVLVLEGLRTLVFAPFLPAASPALAIAGQINRIASWYCIAFAGCAALMAVPRAARAVWGPFVVSVIAIVIRFVLAEELLRNWQVQGIWWSFPMSGVIVVICTVLYYERGAWRSFPQNLDASVSGVLPGRHRWDIRPRP